MPHTKQRKLNEVLSLIGPTPSEAVVDRYLNQLIKDRNRKVVVLDDDPTGTQTVHDVPVITKPNEEQFAKILESPARTFYVLSNSRSLPEHQAVELTERILTDLCNASRRTQTAISVVSRGDSTLRGHFPAETQAAHTKCSCRHSSSWSSGHPSFF